MGADDRLPQLAVTSAAEWEEWLEANHDASEGAWLKIAKKGSGIPSGRAITRVVAGRRTA